MWGVSLFQTSVAMLGMPELLVILTIVILIFGAKKLPALGDAFGKGIRNFKKGIEKGASDEDDEIDVTPVEKKAIDAESSSAVKDVKVEESVSS